MKQPTINTILFLLTLSLFTWEGYQLTQEEPPASQPVQVIEEAKETIYAQAQRPPSTSIRDEIIPTQEADPELEEGDNPANNWYWCSISYWVYDTAKPTSEALPGGYTTRYLYTHPYRVRVLLSHKPGPEDITFVPQPLKNLELRYEVAYVESFKWK